MEQIEVSLHDQILQTYEECLEIIEELKEQKIKDGEVIN